MGRHTTRRDSSKPRGRRSRSGDSFAGARHDAWIYVAFFGSGAAALIFQISWLRQIGLLFGHTVQAASIVVGSFFAGMGIGYLLAVCLLRRIRPLTGYAAAQWTAAAWACLIPALLLLLHRPALAAWLHHSSPIIQTVLRSIFSLALLLPATIALGSTLPFIAEYLHPAGRRAEGRVAGAYAINTVGALLGVMAATMLLLVTVGVRKSSYLAAGISVACGLIAYFLQRAQPSEPAESRPVEAGEPAQAQAKWFWFALVALSGFGTLALEMSYNYMFALVLHNSVYTFGMVLAVFLAALALGAAVAPRLVRRFDPETVVAWACMTGGVGVALSMLAFGAVTGLEYVQYGQSFTGHMAGVLGLVALIVGVPVTVLGVLLPTAWQGAQPGRAGSGRTVGMLTAANTFAATGGSLVAAFLLVPMLGLWPTTLAIGGLFFLVGSYLTVRRRGWVKPLAMGAVFAMSAAAGLVTVSRHQNMLPTEPGAVLVRRWQTPYGWIDVLGIPEKNWLALRENLHYVHGDTGSRVREARQGHLPLLLHPEPERVLFLGLGTGLSAGAALLHPQVRELVSVELIPQVVEAAALFSRHNNNLLSDPRSKVYVDDARHWLLASPEQFDVIVSDLFVPWHSQTGYLYTAEHYRLVRRRLRPDGVFCQWLALNQVGRREFEMIANSFASAFPYTTVWWGRLTPQQSMVMFAGSETPLTLDGAALAGRLAELAGVSDEADPYLRSVTYLYRLYAGRWHAARGAPLNSDEHPRIEFITPVTYRNRELLTFGTLSEYLETVLLRLPEEGVEFLPALGEPLEDFATKQALQRQVLERQVQRRP